MRTMPPERTMTASIRTNGQLSALRLAGLLVACQLLSGCAALTNPVANGLPVERVRPEILGDSREKEQTVPEKFLKAPKQDPYLIAANDVLGVFIRNVTGGDKEMPPVVMSQ